MFCFHVVVCGINGILALRCCRLQCVIREDQLVFFCGSLSLIRRWPRKAAALCSISAKLMKVPQKVILFTCSNDWVVPVNNPAVLIIDFKFTSSWNTTKRFLSSPSNSQQNFYHEGLPQTQRWLCALSYFLCHLLRFDCSGLCAVCQFPQKPRNYSEKKPLFSQTVISLKLRKELGNTCQTWFTLTLRNTTSTPADASVEESKLSLINSNWIVKSLSSSPQSPNAIYVLWEISSDSSARWEFRSHKIKC